MRMNLKEFKKQLKLFPGDIAFAVFTRGQFDDPKYMYVVNKVYISDIIVSKKYDSEYISCVYGCGYRTASIYEVFKTKDDAQKYCDILNGKINLLSIIFLKIKQIFKFNYFTN